VVMAPETPVGPTAQAPPDRPSLGLEQVLRQALALMFGDQRLDANEKRLVRQFFEEVSLRAQNGGIGEGGTPPAGEPGQELPPNPNEMNQNVEDMGTVEGAQPEYEGSY